MKDKLIAFILLIIMLLNLIDVVTDSVHGAPMWHIIQELVIVFISGAMAIYLILSIRKTQRHLSYLRNQLTESDQKIAHITHEMKQARHQYSEVIAQQFNDWQLTQSEQEVAMLLLKGLSLKEISVVRETKEKTVRQQASMIYSKANVDGRHDLSAWFLEDFINQ